MTASRLVLPALLGIALVACGAGAGSVKPDTEPTSVAQVTLPPVTATAAVTPDPEPATEPPTPVPTPKPTATPSPKPAAGPVPPKPSGLEIQTPCLLECGPDDLDGYRLTWKAPRTKGVEIRVYGVTRCFRTDDSEGECLLKGTELPDGVRVLLAKGPASKGVLDLDIVWDRGRRPDRRGVHPVQSDRGWDAVLLDRGGRVRRRRSLDLRHRRPGQLFAGRVPG